MAAAGDSTSSNLPNSFPFQNGVAATPSDTVDLPVITRGIYVGGAGDLTVNLAGQDGSLSNPVLFKAVPVGTTLWIKATRVKATGTTATDLTALW